MTSLRTVLETVGIATVTIGLLFVLRPSLAASVSVPEAALTLLGVIALVEGARSIRKRRRVDVDQAETPTPEEPLRTPMPGEDFDRSLHPGQMGASRVRRRLFEAATDTVSLRRDLDPDEAERRVEEGSWTDDPVAASYLGGPDVPPPPWRTRLRLLLDDRARRRFFAERTVAAIAALWEEE